jgi:hypothetical protein
VSFGTGLFSKSHLSTTGIGATLEGIYATGATAPPRNFAAVQGLVELDTPTGSTNNQTGAEYFVGGIFTSQANVSNGGVGTITLTGTVHSTDVTLPVSSITGIRNGDAILVTLDNGSLFSTMVNGVPSGSNVPILPAMPGTATSGNKVYDYAGQVQAVIASGQLATGGKKFFGAEGIEANSSLRAGSSVFFKCIICTSGNLDDVVQADGPWDMAIGMSGQNGSVGAKVGIGFGPWSGVGPVQPTGTLMKTFDSATVGNGIDISSYTITNYAWQSPGADITGAGQGDFTAVVSSGALRTTGAEASQFQMANGGQTWNINSQSSGGGGVWYLDDFTNSKIPLSVSPNAAASIAIAAAITVTGVTTGTNADFLCLSSGGVILLQTSACTISSLRFKNLIGSVEPADSLNRIVDLRPIAFTMKPGERPNADWNYDKPQIGLSAENVATTMPKCAIYEQDGKTPKSYRQECVIAELVGGMQAQQREIEALKASMK